MAGVPQEPKEGGKHQGSFGGIRWEGGKHWGSHKGASGRRVESGRCHEGATGAQGAIGVGWLVCEPWGGVKQESKKHRGSHGGGGWVGGWEAGAHHASSRKAGGEWEATEVSRCQIVLEFPNCSGTIGSSEAGVLRMG